MAPSIQDAVQLPRCRVHAGESHVIKMAISIRLYSERARRKSVTRAIATRGCWLLLHARYGDWRLENQKAVRSRATEIQRQNAAVG